MERYKAIKNALIASVEGQLGNLQEVDAKELGEVVDMIKDFEEAMYYHCITKAMEKQEEEEKLEEKLGRKFYTPSRMMYTPYDRDMDRDIGRMYYPGQPRRANGEFARGREYYGGEGA